MVITIFNLKNNEQIYTDECEDFCFQSFLYQHSDKLNDLVSVHFTSDEWDKSDDGERQYCSMTAKEFRHKHSYTEKNFLKPTINNRSKYEKYNQYTLENHFKILEIQTGRKNPCDVMEFLEEQYYSTSKEKYIKYKDMDITHLIRVMLNASEDVDNNREEVIRLRVKLNKLTKIMED